MKIDTRKWRSFQIGTLFAKLDLKCLKADFNKSFDVSTERSEEFDLPLVNAKHFNNGIMYYGRSSDFESAEMTLDIVKNGAIATGDVFAQPQRTGVLWDAYLVKPCLEVKSKYVLLFLAACLEKAIKDKFSYDDKCIWEKVSQLSILLPAEANGLPDFGYMEKYMGELQSKVKATVDLLALANTGGGKIDVSKWKRFHLYDAHLFDIDSGTKLDRVKMTDYAPTVNFVGRANANNGVTACIDAIPGLKPYAAGLLTISLGGEYLGSCFVQDKPFYTSQNVNVLIPKRPMSDESKRFIASVIFREGQLHYKAFSDELNRHMKRDFSIPLPALPDGTPDFVYMEKFMRTLASKRATPALSGFRAFVA